MKPVSRFAFIIPVIIAVVAALWLHSDDARDRPSPAQSLASANDRGTFQTGVSGTPVQPPSRLIGKADEIAAPDQLPESLAGTSEPGGWAVTDRLGNLVPTGALRQMFEYYLSALGEEALPLLVARIEAALEVLEQPARKQALDTLGRYLDYKLALSDLEAAYGEAGEYTSDGVLERRMREIQSLRRSWLDADTAEAFFAEEEAIDRYQLTKRRLSKDSNLTEQQREYALAEAEQSLPEPLRQARQETRKFQRYEQVRETMANDPEALRTWRRQTFGDEAAQRLEDLEAKQEHWNQRWEAYSRERDALEASGLAKPEREESLSRLRQRYFSEMERVRVRALDSLQ